MTPEEWVETVFPPITQGGDCTITDDVVADLANAIRAAVAEERERCAKVAEAMTATFEMTQSAIGIQGHVAAAIRGGAA